MDNKLLRAIIPLLLTVLLLAFASCSSRKNTAKSRFWQAFTAKYNTYYNGTLAYIEGSQAKEDGNKDNYTEVIPLYTVGNKNSVSLGSGSFDKAIEKSQKAIKLHSITKRPEWTKSRRKTAKDLEWLNRMALKMNTAVLLEEEMYYYIKRHNSLMRSGITMAYLDRINSYKMCLDEIPEDRHDYRAMGLKAMYSVMLFIRRHAQDPEVKREARRRCEEMFKLTSNEFLHCPISPISKMRSIAGRWLPCLYDAVMRRMDARSSR